VPDSVSAGSDGEVVAWITTVVRRAAYRIAKDLRLRADREMPSDRVAELSGPAQAWEDQVIGRMDAAAICSRFPDREGRACRILAVLGPVPERDLARFLGVSQPTAHRLKHALAAKLTPLMQP